MTMPVAESYYAEHCNCVLKVVAVPLSFPIRRALVNSMSSVMKLVFKECLQCNTLHSCLCRLWILEIRKYKVVPQALPLYTYQLVRTPCHLS